MKWISVKDKLPEDYSTHYLIYVYPNGYEGRAIGYSDEDKWEILWSDDYAESCHISHWLDEET